MKTWGIESYTLLGPFGDAIVMFSQYKCSNRDFVGFDKLEGISAIYLLSYPLRATLVLTSLADMPLPCEVGL